MYNPFLRLMAAIAAVFMTTAAFSQDIKIKGTVTGSDGQPVIAASVMVTGLRNVGAITDNDGRYQLSLNQQQIADGKCHCSIINCKYLAIEMTCH